MSAGSHGGTIAAGAKIKSEHSHFGSNGRSVKTEPKSGSEHGSRKSESDQPRKSKQKGNMPSDLDSTAPFLFDDYHMADVVALLECIWAHVSTLEGRV